MCMKTSIFVAITYSNLLPVENIIKIYASGIYFWPSYHVEHNGAIGIQNRARTKEIKYFFRKLFYTRKVENDITYISDIRGELGIE